MDINVKVENIVATLLIAVSQCIPASVVGLGRKDPPFISPLVRMLLNKRRTLRHSGKVLEADALANEILLFRVSNLSHLVTLPLSPLQNCGLLLFLNTEDMTHIHKSISRLIV